MRSWEEILRPYAYEVAVALKDPIAFYGGVVVLFIVGAVLVSKMDVIACCGGSQFARRRSLKFIGSFAMAVAALSFVLLMYAKTQLTHSVDMDALAEFENSNHSPGYPQANTSFHHSFIDESARGSDASSWSPVDSAASKVMMPSTGLPTANIAPDEPNRFAKKATTGDASQVAASMKAATQFYQEKNYAPALDQVNAVLEMSPENAEGYFLRGNIYAKKKSWAEAESDFQSALRLKGNSVGVSFNLAEIQFLQKRYDTARCGFLALEQTDMGDLSTYKVFLCDLLSGRKAEAARELAAFNAVGSDASYYFANIAWSLVHQQTSDARDWLDSAARVYPQAKFALYSSSLVDLGYLPLPDQPNNVASIH
jgi:tetratricopeptide (TPR) repeat protein